MSTRWNLAKRSLVLDRKLLRSNALPVNERFAFLGRKYAALVRHARGDFSLGRDKTVFLGHPFFYESRYGIAALQGSLTSHVSLLRSAKVDNLATVIDVGANVGGFALAVRRAYPTSTIHCCEPIPAVADALRANVAHDANIIVHEIAIGESVGERRMNFSSANSLISQLDENGQMLVRASTLDAFADSLATETIDLIKIDTETHEDEVLAGAATVLARTRFLMMEITIADNPRYTVSSLFSQLSGGDYDFQLLALRNFSDRSEGTAPILDVVLGNTHLL